jgi:hypothetical protein
VMRIPDDERELAQWQFRPPGTARRRKLHPGRSISPISGTAWKPKSRRHRPGRAILKSSTSVDPTASKVAGAIVLELFSRSRKKNGDWTYQQRVPHRTFTGRFAPRSGGCRSLSLPFWAGRNTTSTLTAAASGVAARKAVPHTLALRLIPLIAATGRLFTRRPPVAGLAAPRLG